MRYRFLKKERLCSKKLTDGLFAEGKSISEYPFRLIWLNTSLKEEVPAQVLISVPRRRIKKAVNRNRIKRLMREAYRLNKHILYQYLSANSIQLAIAIVFNGNEMPTFNDTERKIILLLQRLTQEHEKNGK